MTDHLRLVREVWESLARGELAPLEAALAPQAKWRAVEDGPWNCEDRAAILDVMRYNHEHGRLDGKLEQAFAVDGQHVIAAFRPRGRPDPPWPLQDGVRWVVVTLQGDQITEIRGCRDQSAALAHAGAEPR